MYINTYTYKCVCVFPLNKLRKSYIHYECPLNLDLNEIKFIME